MTVVVVAYPQRTPEQIAHQEALTEQINADPRNPDYRFELAMAYAETGWIELGWNQLALIPQLATDYHKRVLARYEPIVAAEPDNAAAYFRLAFAYYVDNQKTAALDAFKSVLRTRPNHEWSMGLIALVLADQGDYAAARTWCKRALAINGDALAIHFLLGKIDYETGNLWGVMGASVHVARLKSIEAKYRPIPPKGLD